MVSREASEVEGCCDSSVLSSIPDGSKWGSVPERFASIVRLSGDQPALLSEGNAAISYSQLDVLSNQIANRLLRANASSQCRVGVYGERSALVVAALLGVLKAGAVYVPLDPKYPSERLSFLIADAQLDLILVDDTSVGTKAAASANLAGCSAQLLSLSQLEAELSDAPWLPVGERDLAYILYTSGSTGTPKGVAVEHRSIIRLVREPNYVTLTPEQRMLQLAPLSFDASTFEIWGALLNGAVLLIAPPSLALADLANLITTWHIDTMWLTAGFFNVLVQEHPGCLRFVKQLLAGGDVLSPRHVNEALLAMEDGVVINGYGPTENTTFTCCHTAFVADASGSAIPIGRPVSGTTVYLLDGELKPVKTGEIGELYIAGDGLAREYWGRPDLTARSFLSVEVKPGLQERLYRSGDLARYNDEGEIEFCGRKDGQLKIRGFRIEPEEIERTLGSCPGIAAAAVVGKGAAADEKRLCCYYVTNETGDVASQMQSFLSERLPEYMIPTEFRQLDQLPLTPNGKVDRSELRQRSMLPVATATVFADDTEKQLAEIWKTLLQVPAVGPDDDFFHLGGHSLAAARMFSVVHRTFGKQFPLATAMQAPTVRRLAALLRPETERSLNPAIVCLSDNASKIPFFTLHARTGNVLGYKKLAHRLKDFSVFDIRLTIEEEPGERTIPLEEYAADAVKLILAQQPQGPYYLSGYSAYGVLAFEVARQLRMRGAIIGGLVLLDSHIRAPFFTLLKHRRYWAAGACFTRTALWNWRRAKETGLLQYAAQRFPVLASLRSEMSGAQNGDTPDCGHISHALLLALGGYRPFSFDCAAILIKTPQSDQYNPRQSLDWSRLLLSGLQVEYISGNHQTMFTDPHLSMLIEKVQGSLSEPHLLQAA